MEYGTQQLTTQFTAKDGSHFRWTFTRGTVIRAKSWLYSNAWHHDIWIRNDDGREWNAEALPLGVNLTHGQTLVFAGCVETGSGQWRLVAVKNLETREYRVASTRLACDFQQYRYGRRAFWLCSAISAATWWASQAGLLPATLSDHLFSWLSYFVLGSTVLGFFHSVGRDPDEERELDRRVRNSMKEFCSVIQQAEAEDREARSRRMSRSRAQRRLNAPQLHIST